MSSVKWIQLSTNMFDDEKIKLIEQMPDADTLLIIWIKLLTQAGKTNASGYIYLSENIPYTEEMLSTIFNRPLNTIRLALQTFRSFGMLDIMDDNMIHIENWGKYQSLEGLAKIREQNRLRKQRQRDRERQMIESRDSHAAVTDKEEEIELDIERDKDIDIDKDPEKETKTEKDPIPYKDIISHLNEMAGTKYKDTTKKTRTLIQARYKEGFTLDDFKTVIDIKCSQWISDPKMSIYLRPETLFGTKFEGYLNEKGPGPGGPGGGLRNGKNANASKIDAEYNLGF